MTSPRHYAALLSALLVLPLTLSACGGDDGGGVPDDAVAKIGSETISKKTFDHWLNVTAKGQVTQVVPPVELAAPDPPSFKNCIAQKKQLAAAQADGQPAPADAGLKAQCESEYKAVGRAVMSFLINAAWTEAEAADRGVKVSDAEVKKEFDQQRAQNFPKEGDYQQYLKMTGSTPEDQLYRLKIQDLNTKLRENVAGSAGQVTPAQIAAYYNKNKGAFAVAETRDYRVVLSKTPAKAEKIKAMLSGGGSWKAIAAKYSLDKGTSSAGGLLTAVPKGQMVKSLDEATFSAKKGVIGGPVQTPAGYIVYEVEKITPGKQQTLKEAEAAVKQQLLGGQQQTKFAAFTKDFQKRWRDRTECDEDHVIPLCKNAPAAPAPASGGQTTNK